MTNTSGIYPLEYKVLVKPNQVEEKSGGGIVYVDNSVKQEQNAQVNGVLIAVGSMAFSDCDVKPDVGAKVLFAKYAGIYNLEADDNEEYRLMNDKDISAVRY